MLLSDSAAGNQAAGAWLTDDRIVFNSNTTLRMVSAGGGGLTSLEKPGALSSGLSFPGRLPRKDVILVTECITNCVRMTLEVLHLETLARDTLLANTARAWYLPTGDLVAVLQDGTVVGAPFDVKTLRFKTPPVPLLTGVQLELGITPEMAIADDGTLVYLPSSQAGLGGAARSSRGWTAPAGPRRWIPPGGRPSAAWRSRPTGAGWR